MSARSARRAEVPPVECELDTLGRGPKRRAPASIPCCLRPALQYLLFDMLTEADSFVDTIRKGAAVVGLIAGFFVPLGVLFALNDAGWSPAMYLYFATGVQVGAGWVVTYLLVRHVAAISTRTALSIGVVNNFVGMYAGVPTTATYHFHVTLIVVLVFVAVTRLSRPAVFAAAAAPLYLFSVYTHGVKSNRFDFPVALIDGATADLSLMGRLSHHVVHLVAVYGLMLVIEAMHAEYHRSIAAARASAALASEVAATLACYDTQRAKVLLDAAGPLGDAEGDNDDAATAHKDVGDSDDADGRGAATVAIKATRLAGYRGADPELVESLSTIVANLDTYRPHLPNWMLDAAAAHQRNQRAATMPDDWDASSVVADSGRDRSRSHSRSQSERSRASSRQSAVSYLVGEAPSNEARIPARSAVVFSAAGLLGHAPVFDCRKVHVARAELSFNISAADVLSTGSVPRSMRLPSACIAAAATALVDAVHDASRATGAAVHSFVGDRVSLSWNAASSVSAPGVKAVRFLAKVRGAVAAVTLDATARNVCIRVGGAAVSSRARIQLAGGATNPQRALLLSTPPWANGALTSLATAGERFGCFLADTSLASDLASVAAMSVATLPPRRESGHIYRPVYEVVGAVEEAGMDAVAGWIDRPATLRDRDADEPAIAMRGGDIHVTTGAFVAAAVRGEVELASRDLNELRPGFLADHPMVARLRDAVDRIICSDPVAAADSGMPASQRLAAALSLA